MSSLSGCSNTCEVAKKTGSRISDVSLGPRGAMSIRLETQYDHLPQRPQILKTRCAFHRWDGFEMRDLISYCATCNVTLCIDCYKMSHQNTYITQSKIYLLISLINKNYLRTHTLSNPYCKLIINAILSFIISFEI